MDCSDNTQVCKDLKDPSVRMNEAEITLFLPFRPMLGQRGSMEQVCRCPSGRSNKKLTSVIEWFTMTIEIEEDLMFNVLQILTVIFFILTVYSIEHNCDL